MSEVDERLYQAVQQNDLHAAVAALEAGASADYRHREGDDLFPVLYVACKEQNQEMLDTLLARGANPNARYCRPVFMTEDRPCLLAAIPSIGIVKALLEKGADPNTPACSMSSNPTSALQAASGDQELIALLKQYGAKHTQGEFDERLYQAVQQDDVHAALAALEDGASANYVHLEGDSAWTESFPVLYVACEKKNRQLVDLLLAQGADANAKYSLRATWGSASTPCLLASLPSIEIVTALLEQGADPSIPGWLEDNRTPQFALPNAWGNQELNDLLKHYGAREGGDE